VKTMEDLAGCATDDLVGWTEKDQKQAGYLSDFEVSREQAETIIMTARVKAGWVEAAPEPEAAAEEGEEAAG
jgi:N utilization substance protein A